MKVRVLLVSIVLLATMWLAGCGHYVCGTTFGNASCASTGGGGLTPTGGTYLFVADAGGIQGETLDGSAGTITVTKGFVSPKVPNVPSGWMAMAQEKYMYVGYPSSGSIYGWGLNGDGSITNLTSVYPFVVTYTMGGGSQAMIANPTGTLLFAIDPTGQAVHVYTIGALGGLLEATGSPVLLPSGFQPFNMAIDGLGKYLYVSNIVGGTSTSEIAAFSIGSGGALTAVTGSPFLASANSQFALMQMQGESSGKYMIGTTSSQFVADLHLYVLGIQSDGSLVPVTGSPFTTQSSPNTVTVQPSSGGTLVYSFGFGNGAISGAVEGYTLNLSTGALSAIANSPFSVNGAFGEFDPSGKYLFVEESSSTSTTNMDVYNVSTSATLTTPVATVGWGPGAWAAADVP